MPDKIKYVEWLEKEQDKWAEEHPDFIENFKTLYDAMNNLARILAENDELRNTLSDILKDKNNGRQN